MTPEQSAAFVFSQSVCALAQIEAMKAENVMRSIRGESPAYGEDNFLLITENYGISHNSVVEIMRQAT